jgi:hypothetical protein
MGLFAKLVVAKAAGDERKAQAILDHFADQDNVIHLTPQKARRPGVIYTRHFPKLGDCLFGVWVKPENCIGQDWQTTTLVGRILKHDTGMQMVYEVETQNSIYTVIYLR